MSEKTMSEIWQVKIIEKQFKIFSNGAGWLRADFHLHTKADREFLYFDNENDFLKKYIERLKQERINLGVVANHNKFDSGEFKALRKKAFKEEIYLIAGIEFSIKDGSNGIHIIIAFDDDWYINMENKNYIQSFLENAFFGISNYDVPQYPNSNYDLKQTIEKLNETGKNYFIIMAHIDDRNGMCKELTGRNFESFVQYCHYSNSALAFQKCRKQVNLNKLKRLINQADFPALVEGSDGKNIEEVGKAHVQNSTEKKTFIKIGDFNFDAVKIALKDAKNRVSSDSIPSSKNTFMKSIKFIGGTEGNFNGDLEFSNNLNAFIGIRGSGKSSVLEVIRYAFGKLPFTDKVYKSNLIERTLGSGGKIELEICCKTGANYKVSKIFKERANVYRNGDFLENVTIDNLLENEKIIYFGQKDLSYKDSDYNERLIQNLIGKRLTAIRKTIALKQAEIERTLFELDKHKDWTDKLNEFLAEKSTLEHKLELFREKKIDTKLQTQVNFKRDISKLTEIDEWIGRLLHDYDEQLEKHEPEFEYHRIYESMENQALFRNINVEIDQIEDSFNQIKQSIEQTNLNKANINNKKEILVRKYNALLEDFAKVKRQINEPNLRADDFIKYSDNLRMNNLKINEARKSIKKRGLYKKQFSAQLKELKELWHDEFNIMKKEAERINAQGLPIKIDVKYKANKEKFDRFLSEMMRGQNILASNRRKIANAYNDCIEIYQDLENNSGKINDILSGGNQLINFRERFESNLFNLLTYKPEEKIIITYNGKELKDHSAGQRASAIMLFLLTQEESDIVIIDQPEDDLDNQSIYEELIKVLLKLKNKTQFIFATHSPNIVVLGDSEKVFSCEYSDDKIFVKQGSIDDTKIQEEIISVMEGGQKALDKRKEIYGLWKR